MTPASTNHLSEEALDDVLIGLGTAESRAHLAVCAECRAQVQTVRGDISLFNAASMAWSESRHPLPPAIAPRRRFLPAAFIRWAAAATALLVMAAGIWRHHPQTPSSQAITVQQSQPTDTEAQISQDNQLLQAVNSAISPDEMSPIVEYRIVESPHSHTKGHSKTRIK
jgi:hypothetical protein